jgi:betaine-aldehyde dehydrogenase
MMTNLLTDHDSVFIGGRWTPAASRQRIEVVNPSTEEVIASVPSGSTEDVDRAVSEAQRALTSGSWPDLDLNERISIILRLRKLLISRSEEFAQLITAQMGSPITQSRSLQVVNPVRILDAYVGVAESYPFRELRSSEFGRALVLKRPVGVVAAVGPWNVPMSMAVQKTIPALLAGCTVVLKPAPETPLDSYLFADLLNEAGLPPGVVNVVTADREASEYLVSHPDVAKVTFTGSTVAGKRIGELCGRDLRRVTLELGGKSAAIVLEDADLDKAVSSLRLGSFRNSGQICSLKTRIIVPRARKDEFLDRFAALTGSLRVGDPLDEATEIGPMVSSRQRTRVEGFIEEGRSSGATLVSGGGRPADLERGWFVEPTLFADVDPHSRIAQEEIFGPVVTVIDYDTVDEAVAIANNSAYGLGGSVFTTDIERGLQVARRIQTGAVELNGSPAGFNVPMGGVKNSGVGREFGPEGLDPFVESMSIGLPAEAADAIIGVEV